MKSLILLFSLLLGVMFTSNHYPAYYTGYHVVKQDTLYSCKKDYPIVVYHIDTVVCCFKNNNDIITIFEKSNPNCGKFYFIDNRIYCTEVCGINPIFNYTLN